MMKLIFLLVLSVVPSLLFASSGDTINRIEKLWYERDSENAFKEIINAVENREDIDIRKLTELTGVRKIHKIVEGQGSETSNFIDNNYIVLTGFTGGIRIYDVKNEKIHDLSGFVFPVADLKGIICRSSRWFYYYFADNTKYVIYEYDTKRRLSKPIGDFSRENFYFRYDESLLQLQVVNIEDKILATFDLNMRQRIDSKTIVLGRRKHPTTNVDVQTTPNRIRLTVNQKVIEMPYPSREFLEGNPERTLYVDDNNPGAILTSTLWLPGLNILFDFNKIRSLKVFFPRWLDPSVATVSWKLILNRLYIWLDNGEKNGLYMIDLSEIPSAREFEWLIYDYQLAHEDSKAGQQA